MSEKGTSGNFIIDWLSTRKDDDELDQHVLKLIEKNIVDFNTGDLKEADLLSDLLALSSQSQDQDK